MDGSQQCAALLNEGHTAWCAQVVSEFEINLEIIVLLAGRNDCSEHFARIDLVRVFEMSHECHFSLPSYPLRRIRAEASSGYQVNLHSLHLLQKRVELLWMNFFVNLCHFEDLGRLNLNHPLLSEQRHFLEIPGKPSFFIDFVIKLKEELQEEVNSVDADDTFDIYQSLVLLVLLFFLHKVDINGKNRELYYIFERF